MLAAALPCRGTAAINMDAPSASCCMCWQKACLGSALVCRDPSFSPSADNSTPPRPRPPQHRNACSTYSVFSVQECLGILRKLYKKINPLLAEIDLQIILEHSRSPLLETCSKFNFWFFFFFFLEELIHFRNQSISFLTDIFQRRKNFFHILSLIRKLRIGMWGLQPYLFFPC